MSIRSTITISRYQAIMRIENIHNLIVNFDYNSLSDASFEPEKDIQYFVDNFKKLSIENISKWTNEMLEEILDKPYFRYSMFDNYNVIDH